MHTVANQVKCVPSRITIRKTGPGRWTVTRPGYGFSLAPTTTEHPTQQAAIRSLRGKPVGTSTATIEHAGLRHDGLASISPWTPLSDEPNGPDTDGTPG